MPSHFGHHADRVLFGSRSSREGGGPSPEEMGLKPEDLRTPESQAAAEQLKSNDGSEALTEQPVKDEKTGFIDQVKGKLSEIRGNKQSEILPVSVDLEKFAHKRRSNELRGTIDGHDVWINRRSGGGRHPISWFEGTIDGVYLDHEDAKKIFKRYEPSARLAGRLEQAGTNDNGEKLWREREPGPLHGDGSTPVLNVEGRPLSNSVKAQEERQELLKKWLG